MTADPYSEVLGHLREDGVHIFGKILSAEKATGLYQQALSRKNLGPHIFLREDEYRANPKHFGVNPARGANNLLEQFDSELSFVEQDPDLAPILETLLGPGYEIFLKKFVCAVPFSWIPDWLKAQLENSPINNLGAFVKPEYRDITYFYGIDFHQDTIDWPATGGSVKAYELLTLYVYINDVSQQDAPLYILPKSHRFGATVFPHDLQRLGNTTRWVYTDDKGRSMTCSHAMLTGGAGYVALWHSALLHGSQGIREVRDSDRMRLSLRYLLRRSGTAANVGIDDVNAVIDGPLSLPYTRKDLDSQRQIVLKQNAINKIP